MNLIVEKKIECIDELELLMSQYLSYFREDSKIALQGPMGIGKTHWVKIFLKLMNCQERVTSPTFTLINEYEWEQGGRMITAKHIDLYRLGELKNSHSKKGQIESSILFNDLPLFDILNSQDLVLVEWSDLFPELRDHYDYQVEMNFLEEISRSNSTRKIEVFSIN